MILPDANLILYAYDLESPFHPVAADWWTRCLNEVEPVGLAQVILFAFLRLGTSPRVFANPLSLADAIREIRAWAAQPNVRVLATDQDHWQLLYGPSSGSCRVRWRLAPDSSITFFTKNLRPKRWRRLSAHCAPCSRKLGAGLCTGC